MNRINRLILIAGQLWCGLFGHNVILTYEDSRLSLTCPNCGYNTPGWEVASAAECRAKVATA